MIVLNSDDQAVLAATLNVLLEATTRDPWQCRRLPPGGVDLVRRVAAACADQSKSAQAASPAAPVEHSGHDASMPKVLLDRTETANVLGVSEGTVRRLISEGDLCAIRVRGQIRVHVDDLDAYLSRQRETAA